MNLLQLTKTVGRSALYFGESIPLIVLSNLYANKGKAQPPKPEELRSAFKAIYELHKWDIENVEKGLYPKSVLQTRSAFKHALSLSRVMSDAVKVGMRMRQQKNYDFSEQALDIGEGLPEYYVRNFHFQTDGYLSEDSAKIYDHQVEILFNGSAQTMRRLSLIPILKKYSREDTFSILDIGCGTGSLTVDLARTFPKAQITAIDLSFPYLKQAQRRLKKFPRVGFLQANAEDLPFKDSAYDVVVSCYLMHELPRSAREKVIQEMVRLKKPEGVGVITDALQNNDNPELDWALERFPISYHEPFFKNYLQHSTERMVESLTGTIASTEKGFFTKAVSW
ncbi:MAG: class I SAM-dependent methyltransferase [Bdellovibrionaceae bacterium]|nr:class I SAM-dependent methyltransferase [Pseudobdellovibrionaceae bacterium]